MALSAPESHPVHGLLARPELRAELDAHAMKAFPKECCALLLEGPSGPRVWLADNLADRLHAADPVAFPHPAERAFVLDVRLIVEAERQGLALIALVHSHCSAGAYFSAEDLRLATTPTGEPLYPGVAHVVLDAWPEGVLGYAAFTWSPETRGFVRF